MRPSKVLTAAMACATALALGCLAVAAARAVPATPPPAYVSHYLDELRENPPPPASAAILAEVAPIEPVSGDDEVIEPPGTGTVSPGGASPSTTLDDHGGRRPDDDPADADPPDTEEPREELLGDHSGPGDGDGASGSGDSSGSSGSSDSGGSSDDGD